jgi:two-component system nitrogen regulation sensor histidine kinase GlnL
MDSQLCRHLVENMDTAVLLFDSSLTLIAINPAGENLLQASTRKLMGKSYKHVFPQNKECHDILTTILEENRTITEREIRLILITGQTITIDFSATPISGPQQVSEIIVEITHVDRLLRLAREDHLQEQYEATRKILKGIAHEVKNPLGGLRGAAQLLDMELEDETQKEYTRVIIKEADRLSGLVDAMAGPNKPLDLQSINIHACLEHVRTLINAEYPEIVSISTNYDPSLPEFTTRPAGRFTIGNILHRTVLQLDIEDNGPGIPEDLQATVFYPLITGKPEGTGLGLSIVQNIINQHHGLVEFTSRKGKTVFSIFLSSFHLQAKLSS